MVRNIDDLFSEGITLRDDGQLEQSAKVFSKIIQDYPDAPKLGVVYTVAAGVYFDLRNFEMSRSYFSTATRLKPEYELASLGLYLSYVKLGNSEKAINELKRYLEITRQNYIETH